MFKLEIILTVLTISLNLALSRPAEEPIRIDLTPTQATDLSSRLQEGKELLGQLADRVRFGRGRFVNSAAMVRNIIVNHAEEAASEAQNNVASVIAAKSDIVAQGQNVLNSIQKGVFANFLAPKTRETVRLESEAGQAFFERNKESPVETILGNILRPTPLVDGIREEEKYGNSGDKFSGIGRALVNGFEGISNFLNSVVDLPIDAAKKTSRGVTEALNQIGARLIGLQ
ncbi:uncharacterized protein LOC107266839 [Cephus cinctus]|uniref:Uncharacterized protein LOC107266839 n=1 Tax=Cephus cinctus TaxID=211228 RepID=A0AAJ7BSH1_CEPCN|nr:uncharacterized protein LOC107266839 [Cephus cinctus]